MSVTLTNVYAFSTSVNPAAQIMQNQSRAGMVFKMRINSLQGNTLPSETGFLAKVIFDFWHYFNPSNNSAANVELSFGANIRIGSVPLANGVVYSIGLSYDGVNGAQRYYINGVPTVLGNFKGNTTDRQDAMTLGVATPGCIVNFTMDDIFIWNGYTPTGAEISSIVNGTDPATIGTTATKRFRWTLNGPTGNAPLIGDVGLKNVFGNGTDGTDFATVSGPGSARYDDPLVWTSSADIDNAYVASSGKTVVSFFKSTLTGLRTTPSAVYNTPRLTVNGVDQGALEKPWFPGYMPFVFYSTPNSLQIQPQDVVSLTAPAGWVNTPVGGTAALEQRPIDNRTQVSVVGSDTVTRTMRMGLNNSQLPTTPSPIGLYFPLKNLKYRVGWGPGNRGRFSSSGTLPVSDMNGPNYMDNTAYPGIAGLWLVMWDDDNLAKPLDSFLLTTLQPTYTSVIERTDLRSSGVSGIGHCRVFDFQNIPGHTTASIDVELNFNIATINAPNYVNLWVVAPGDWDIVDGAVALDRSDPFVLSRRYVDRLGSNVSCLRWVDSSITGGNPLSIPYPEYRSLSSNENWGDLSFISPRFGFQSIGPVDPVATPWVYSPRYGKPGMAGSTFPTTLSGEITTSPVPGTHETYAFADAATAPLMIGLEIQLDSEVCRIMGVTGTQVTLYRGSNGTTPAPHLPGVYQVYGRNPSTHIFQANGCVGNAYTYQFVTSTPHGLTAGNVFLIEGSYPPLSWSGGETNVPLLVRFTHVLGANIIATAWGPSATSAGSKPTTITALDPNTHYSDMRYFGSLPIETTCNITGRFPHCDIHLNFPLDACDDFAWEYARTVLANFPAGRKVFLEYANEPWNWEFTAFGYLTVASNYLVGIVPSFPLQYYIQRAGEIWAIFESVFGSAGREAEIYGLVNCQMGSADASNYLTYAASHNIKVGAVATAPYLSMEATALNANVVNTYDDEQAIDMFIHDFYFNPRTYNSWVRTAITAITSYNNTTGNNCLLVGYEGGVEHALPNGSGVTITQQSPREHDIVYNPNYYFAEQDFYLWLQNFGYHHLNIYALSIFWSPSLWGMYHGFQQDHGRGDGSDGKFDNRTLKANPTSPHYKGATVNQDRYAVSVRGQAYLDWNVPSAPGIVSGLARLACASQCVLNFPGLRNSSAKLACASVCKAVPTTRHGRMTLEEALFMRTTDELAWDIYPGIIPQTVVKPAITYQVIDTQHQQSLAGLVGMAQSRVQFTCYSPTLADVVSMLEQIRLCWQGFCSARDGYVGGTFDFVSSYQLGEPTTQEFRDAGTDEWSYEGVQDLGFLWRETIP